MGFLAGLALTAGANLLSGNSQERKQKRNLDRALRAQYNAEQERLKYEGYAGAQEARGMDDIRSGFAASLGATRAAGGAVRAQARTQGQSRQGAAQMNSFDRGLVGTSGGRALTAAAARDSARNMAGVEAQLAQLEGALQTGQGQALASQRGVIAQGFRGRGQAAEQHARDVANLRGSIQYEDGMGDFTTGLMGALGSYYGGKGGGSDASKFASRLAGWGGIRG